MHLWRPVAIVGAGFTGLALLFPFATFPVLGVLNGIDADAWPALLPLAPVVAVAVIGDWSRGLRPMAAFPVIVMACLAVLFAVLKLADAAVATRDIAGASLGAGNFVLLGGTLIALTGSALSLTRG